MTLPLSASATSRWLVVARAGSVVAAGGTPTTAAAPTAAPAWGPSWRWWGYGTSTPTTTCHEIATLAAAAAAATTIFVLAHQSEDGWAEQQPHERQQGRVVCRRGEVGEGHDDGELLRNMDRRHRHRRRQEVDNKEKDPSIDGWWWGRMYSSAILLRPPSSLAVAAAAGSASAAAAAAAASPPLVGTTSGQRRPTTVVSFLMGADMIARCEEREDEDEMMNATDNNDHDNHLHRFEARYPTGYTEPERFAQALEYHRSLLFDYLRRWEMTTTHHCQPTEHQHPKTTPRNHHHHHRNHNHHPSAQVHAPQQTSTGAAATTDMAEVTGSESSPVVGPSIPSSSSSSSWPRHVPDAEDVPALEFDLHFCRKQRRLKRKERQQQDDLDRRTGTPPYLASSSPLLTATEPVVNENPTVTTSTSSNSPLPIRDVCQNIEFRVAAYYLSQTSRPDDVRRGFRLVKELAENGHPDGMCLYGMILMDGPGRVPTVRRRPEEAVRWLQRAAALHRHIVATYELGVAHYTGEGFASPDPGHAIRLFQQAAHLGHSGAAYMLGECLLDGVGCDRDRASALEWLLTAAELGHGLARERALMVLLEDHTQLVQEATSDEHVVTGRRNEALKWLEGRNEEVVINLERRHTIGGAEIKVPQGQGSISRSAAVKERRMSKVRESRDESNQLYHHPPPHPAHDDSSTDRPSQQDSGDDKE